MWRKSLSINASDQHMSNNLPIGQITASPRCDWHHHVIQVVPLKDAKYGYKFWKGKKAVHALPLSELSPKLGIFLVPDMAPWPRNILVFFSFSFYFIFLVAATYTNTSTISDQEFDMLQEFEIPDFLS